MQEPSYQVSVHRLHLQVRLDAFISRRIQREARFTGVIDQIERKQAARADYRTSNRSAIDQTLADRGTIADSRYGVDVGKRAVTMEPAALTSWPAGPPHMISHWKSISQTHNDPPRAFPQHSLQSYRKPFPHIDERLKMQKRCRWGGTTEDLALYDTLPTMAN